MSAQPDVDSARRNPGRPWAVAALLLTTGASLALMFLPTYSTADDAGNTNQQSLIEYEGWDAAVVLAIPVLISAIPWFVPVPHRRWATTGAAVLLAAGSLVSAASVGLFYLPGAAMLVVAAVRTRTVRQPTSAV